MLSEIQLAIASITGAKTIAEGLIAERDAHKMRLATSELLTRVLEAQNAVLSIQATQQALLNENAALAQRLRDAEAKLVGTLKEEERFAEYELADVARGTFVFAPKPDPHGVRRQPYLCPACKSGGKNTVLQFQQRGARTFVCPVNSGHTIPLPRGGWTPENIGRPEYVAKP